MLNPVQVGITTVLPGLVAMSRFYVIWTETSAQLLKLQTDSACYAVAGGARFFQALKVPYLPVDGSRLAFRHTEFDSLADMGQAYMEAFSHWSSAVSGLLGDSLATGLSIGGSVTRRSYPATLLPGPDGAPAVSERRVASVVIDFPDRRSDAMKRAMAMNGKPRRPRSENSRGG